MNPSTQVSGHALNPNSLAAYYPRQPRPIYLVLAVATLVLGLGGVIVQQATSGQDSTWKRTFSPAVSPNPDAARAPRLLPPSNTPYTIPLAPGDFPPNMPVETIIAKLMAQRLESAERVARIAAEKGIPLGQQGQSHGAPPLSTLVGEPQEVCERYLESFRQTSQVQDFKYLTQMKQTVTPEVTPEMEASLPLEMRGKSMEPRQVTLVYYQVDQLDEKYLNRPATRQLVELGFVYNAEIKTHALVWVRQFDATHPVWELMRK